MQRDIDDLKKQLRRPQQKQSPSRSDVSSNDEKNTMYRQRSRTRQANPFSVRKSAFTEGNAEALLVKE